MTVNHMKNLYLMAVLAIPTILAGTAALAQSTAATSTRNNVVAPDNTKSNKVDASDRTATSDNQSNDATDINLAKRIRQSVMADKNLSTYGHNVKIVAVNGTVTLNGVVRNSDEKAQIGKKALAIAGAGHVVDELKLASSK